MVVVIICIGLIFIGGIMLSNAEEAPKEEKRTHKCIFATTCKEAPTCLHEEKESCFVERKN